MISICLKSNNISFLNNIEDKLDTTTFPEIYYSQKKFKIYNNIILHYKGKNIDKFYDVFSNILTNLIIEQYEKSFVKQQLSYDFFYFSADEKKSIQDLVLKDLNLEINKKQKNMILKKCITEYFCSNFSCNLDGFINFRLYNYKNFINLLLENTINDYIIKKEYIEYVNLLQEYITIKQPQSEVVHLIYNDETKMLLDNSKNVITNTNDQQIYLSDISFSSNDFILNSLLSLLPQKLYIHLDESEDNFIKFLELIFKDRYVIC